MQFLVIAYDGTDDNAMQRRMAVREQHIALVDKLRATGNILYGAALLNDQDQMIGSAMVMNFDSREQLDQWLKIEPYVTGNVWETITVQNIRSGPSFADLHKIPAHV